MDSGERFIRTEAVRTTNLRKNYGSLRPLADDIRTNGLRHPITVWQDGTLISGGRRLRAHMLLQRPAVQAVFVHTVEDATKALQRDNDDTHLSLPWKWSEVCRLWELLRRLDEPAARKRADDNRRKGVELRRQTLAGKRKPGRANQRGEDHIMALMAAPFGISDASARRVLAVYNMATGVVDATDEKRKLAQRVMDDIDQYGNIWANYQRLMGIRKAPVSPPRPTAPPREPAAARQQLDAWSRAMPQLVGLTTGLVELGPPNPELTWDQVGPVHAQLAVVRRELEKIIRQMKEMQK